MRGEILIEIIRGEIATISAEVSKLEVISARFELRQRVQIRQLHDQLVQSVEQVIEKRLDDVFRSVQAANGLADHIHIHKLDACELPRKLARFNDDLRAVEERVASTTHDWQLLQTLYFENIWIRHDRIVSAHSETFTWVFRGEAPDSGNPIRYVEWLRKHDGIFWIHGKPGSGKSTLMKFLVHHPDTAKHLQVWAGSKRLVVAKFFFWNSGTRLQKSQEGLLRSLLFEILRQVPALLPEVRQTLLGAEPRTNGLPQTEPHSPQHYGARWNLKSLLRVFTYLHERDIGANFCFFIDGLDEYRDEDGNDHRELIRLLRHFTASPQIKLCVSSRPWTVFRDAFQDDPDWTIKLEDLTRDDIRCYVSDTFGAHEQYSKLSRMDSGYKQLVENVVQKAQGVFLWVFLVVRDLLEGLTFNDTIKTMHMRLDRFPEDLDDYFRHIFDSIPKVYRIQTARTFQIALSRDTPLPLITYALMDDVEEDPALDIHSSPDLEQGQMEMKLAMMWRRLDGRSKGLLEVVVTERQYLVEFLHRTVRDFLFHTPEVQDEMMGSLKNKAETWVLLCRASSLMMRKCHDVKLEDCLHQMFYSAQLAIQDSGDDGVVDRVFSDVFSRNPRLRLNTSESDGGDKKSAPEGVFDICLAAEYGLVSYVKKQLTRQLQLMDETVSSSSEEDKKSLLSRVLLHSLTGEKGYHKLSPDLVEFLLSLGASANFEVHRNNVDTTVFAVFISELESEKMSPSDPGVTDTLKTLLANGCDIFAKIDSRLALEPVSWERIPTRKDLTAEEVIQKCFAIEKAEWLLSFAVERGSARHQKRETDLEVVQKHANPKGSSAAQASALEPPKDPRQTLKHCVGTSSTGPNSSRNLHPIKIHDVDRRLILDSRGEPFPGILRSLGQRNNVDVAAVASLGRRNKSERKGCVVAYVTNEENVARLLADGVFYVSEQPKRVSVFHQQAPRATLLQCYNCQQIGHESSRCRRSKVCAKCATKGHHHSTCRMAFTRCAVCSGPHMSIKGHCPRLS